MIGWPLLGFDPVASAPLAALPALSPSVTATLQAQACL